MVLCTVTVVASIDGVMVRLITDWLMSRNCQSDLTHDYNLTVGKSASTLVNYHSLHHCDNDSRVDSQVASVWS